MSALSVEEWNVSVVFEAVLWGAFIEQTRGCTVPSQGKGSCWFGIRAVQGWQWPRAVSPENIRVCSAQLHPDEHSDHRGASGEKGDLDLDQSEPSAAAAGGTGAAPLERGFELWHQEGGKLSRKGGRMSQVYRQLAQASAGGKQVRPLQAEEAVGRTMAVAARPPGTAPTVGGRWEEKPRSGQRASLPPVRHLVKETDSHAAWKGAPLINIF